MNQQLTGVVAGTTPYAWPFDQGLAADRVALVVCGAGDARVGPIAADAEVEANIGRLRRAAVSVDVPVFLIDHDLSLEPNRRHRTDRRLDHSPATGHSARQLTPAGAERVVHAAGVDGFFGSALDVMLRAAGIDELIVFGRGFETTVHSTIRTANDAGYECLTVADACLTVDADCRSAAISTIEMSGGIFGAVGSARNVVLALELLSPVSLSIPK
ncbi:MAG: cysteine hydrolase [Actinomycetota bacterium]|nr:cysteine hydrolase [Actinomycetota bacterium]